MIRWSTILFALAVLLTAARAHGAEAGPEDYPPVSAAENDPEPWKAGRGRIQVRRENVDRGTSEETTRTYVRADTFVGEGMLSFQVAFPDADTDFGGSPFDPRLGDSKVRYRFAPFRAGGVGVSYFLEATFPTAHDDLGSGKYQVSAGATGTIRVPKAEVSPSHFVRFTMQLQQVNSVAGDENRPDINYTKLDLSLRDVFGDHWLKGAFNTRADWELGKTGAVGEVEYGRRLTNDWSVWFLAGGRLWGEGVKATYGSKIMIGVDRWF